MKFLPNTPNLDYLKKKAKQLRALHHQRDTAACSRIRHYDTSFAEKSDDEIFNSDFSILDAQRVIAREYGFSSWAKLKRFVESTNQHFNPEIHDELIQMQNGDAEVRKRLASEGVLYDGYPPEMEAVHNQNAARLKSIIQAYGWPVAALPGESCNMR